MANPTWDETEEVAPAAPTWDDTTETKSFMEKEIPLTPFFDPTLQDVKDTAVPVLETAQDAAIGATQGATLGAADEIGGGLAALLEKGASYIPGTGANELKKANEQLGIPDESLKDSYRGYQKASEKAFNDANERSPIANTVGNIGGSVASGTAAGGALGLNKAAQGGQSVFDIYKNQGKMKALLELGKRGGMSAAKAAPAMAVESALVSEGNLDNEQSREKLLGDVGNGLAFGVPAMLGLNGITEVAAPAAKAAMKTADDKFGKFVQDTPFLRKYGIGIKHGEMGTKPTTEAGLNALEAQQIDRTTGMLDNVYAADKTLGKAVGKSLEDATLAGVQLDIAKPVTKAINALNFSYNTFQDMAETARGRHIFEKIQSNTAGPVSPADAKGLLDDIDAFIGKFNASRNRTTGEEATLSTLQKVRKELSDQMKKDIPEYGLAAERFTDYRKNVPETMLSKDRPVDVTGMFMGNLKNADKQMYDAMNELQMNASSQGSGASNSRKAYGNLMKNMQQFEANEATRNAALQAAGKAPNASPLVQNSADFGKQLRQYSDEAGFLKDVQTVKSPFVTQANLVSQVGQLGHSGALSTSLLVGKAKKPIAEISRRAYNMPAEKLGTLAVQMKATPQLRVLGQALEDGLRNGDQAKKNAAIFSILQNPEAALYFQNEDEN